MTLRLDALLFDACARFHARPAQADEHTAGREPPANIDACEAAGEAVLAEVTAAVAHGITDGTIAREVGDPGLFAVTLWGLTHGVIQIALAKAKAKSGSCSAIRMSAPTNSRRCN